MVCDSRCLVAFTGRPSSGTVGAFNQYGRQRVCSVHCLKDDKNDKLLPMYGAASNCNRKKVAAS